MLSVGMGALPAAARAPNGSCANEATGPVPKAWGADGPCLPAPQLPDGATGQQGNVQSVDARGSVALEPTRFLFAKNVVIRQLRWRAWTDHVAIAKGKLKGLSPEPKNARLRLTRPTGCLAGTLFLEAKLKIQGGIDERRNYDCFC
jgi:hypothetical protein